MIILDLLQGTWKHAYAYDYGSFERFKAQYEYSCSFVSAMDPVFTRDKFLNKNLFRQCGKVLGGKEEIVN